MDQVVVVLEGEDWARVSLLVDGVELQRESGTPDEVPSLVLALEA